LCSDCFSDQGLKLDAAALGIERGVACRQCKSLVGKKLHRGAVWALTRRYFMWGSLHRAKYGAAPEVAFNDLRPTDIKTPGWLEPDVRLIENAIGVGLFHYGPRLWMIGQVYPLLDLQDSSKRAAVIQRVLNEYPAAQLGAKETFYRIRKNPSNPERSDEYDSPPKPASTAGLSGRAHGRLDSSSLSILYGSQDLQVCLHECRVSAEDNTFVATIAPKRDFRLLDLSFLLEEDKTEFESLDMAIHMLFLAAEHSYDICRQIAIAAAGAGYDGLIYPSYFSMLRTGSMPFETTFGISHRIWPAFRNYERAKIIPNLALFGRPLEEGKVEVRCIDRIVLRQVEYVVHYGPVGIS
jgi:RES domain